MSTGIKLSKTEISKRVQSGGFLGSLLSKTAVPLMKVAVPIAKSILRITLGTTALLQQLMQEFKKIHGSGTATLIISDEEMNDIINIVQALEDSNILLKGITKTFENETEK